MTISYWQDAHIPKNIGRVDVAIIGGGIMGATTAYWLSKRKGLKVAVFEAQKRGWGTSGRNAGFVMRSVFGYYSELAASLGRERARQLFAFNEETLAHLNEFAAAGNNFHYEPCGSYLLAASAKELQVLEESAELLNEDGFAVQLITSDPLERNYSGALFEPHDAGVHSALLVDALFAASGVPLLEAEPVRKLEPLPGGGIELTSMQHKLSCDRVLLLTNAYTPLLEPWFIGKIQPVRAQALVTKPLPRRILDKLCYANYGWDYFRQLPDNRLLLGGCRQYSLKEEIGYADMITEPVQTALDRYLQENFPEAAGIPVDYRWSGIMAFTKDELPIIGELVQSGFMQGHNTPTPVPGVFYAIGCNGHGMGYSFALSRLLVSVALDGANAGMFSADRLDKLPVCAGAHAGFQHFS